jgi:hypothetical protein
MSSRTPGWSSTIIIFMREKPAAPGDHSIAHLRAASHQALYAARGWRLGTPLGVAT